MIPSNEHTSRCDENCAHSMGVGIQLTSHGSKHDKPGTLPQSAEQKRSPSSESFNKPQTRERANDIHTSQDNLRNITIRDPHGLENRCAIVEKVIRTS